MKTLNKYRYDAEIGANRLCDWWLRSCVDECFNPESVGVIWKNDGYAAIPDSSGVLYMHTDPNFYDSCKCVWSNVGFEI